MNQEMRTPECSLYSSGRYLQKREELLRYGVGVTGIEGPVGDIVPNSVLVSKGDQESGLHQHG